MEMISNIYSANCAGIMSQTGNKQRKKNKKDKDGGIDKRNRCRNT